MFMHGCLAGRQSGSLNASKTQIIILSRGKVRKIPDFALGAEKI
jgi:hypothetical protein